MKTIDWIFGLMILGLVFIELIFGTWLWGDPLSQLNIIRGVEWIYSVDQYYPRPEPIVYRRDRWGFRGTYGQPSDINILVLGGSTTDERLINEGETWPDVLAGCLRRGGYDVRLANASVTGQTSRGHLANFDLWFSRMPGLKPRYVLAYLGINELWVEAVEEKDDPRRFNEEIQPHARWAEIFHWVKMKSAFYQLYRTAKGQWIAIREGIAYGLPRAGGQRGVDDIARRYAEKADQTIEPDSWAHSRRVAQARVAYAAQRKAFRSRLEKLYQRIRRFGAEPLFVTQTWATYRRQGNVISGDIDRYFIQNTYNDVTLDFCETRGVTCVDLGGRLTFLSGDTFDVIHTTPQGSRRVGEFICKELMRDPGFSLPRSDGG